MEAVKVSNLTFRYPETEKDVLQNISFAVNQGDFVTLCGISGSGKTTLLRHLKPALTPYGKRDGEVRIFGREINALSHREQSSKIGYVMQSPETRLSPTRCGTSLRSGLKVLAVTT